MITDVITLSLSIFIKKKKKINVNENRTDFILVISFMYKNL